MKKILVIDDAPDVREMLSDFLIMEGYEVVTAGNGEEGLKIFQETEPVAAIVDIEMPKMNGLEFSKKALEIRPDFPILIISAYVEKYSISYIKQLGVRAILKKPIVLKHLADELKKVIDAVEAS